MSRFTAAHSASWGRNGPRNLLGPLGTRSLGGEELINLVEVSKFAIDVASGTSFVVNHGLATRDVKVQVYRNSTPWDTVECEIEHTDANNVTLRFDVAVSAAQYRVVVLGRVPTWFPDSIKPKHPRVLPPARRGQPYRFPMVGAAGNAGYQLPPPPKIIQPAIRRRNFALARRGRIIPPFMVGRAPGQLDTPPFIRQTKRQVFVLARRGQFYRFSIVGRAPGQIDTPPFIRTSKRQVFTLARRGQFYRFPIVGLAPGQIGPQPFIRQTRRPHLPTRRGRVFFSPFPFVAVAGPQAKPPDWIRPANRRRTFALARRGKNAYVPPPVFIPPDPRTPDRIVPVNRRRQFALARRGQFLRFPIVGRAPGQLDAPPFVRTTKRQIFTLARRGQFYRLPIVASALGYQTAWIPPIPSRRQPRIFALARRGQYFDFNATPTQTPWIPPNLLRRSPRGFARRGQFFSFGCTPTQTPWTPPPLVRRSPRSFALARRGQFFSFNVTRTQSAWIPPIPSRRQPRVFALARRGQFFDFAVTATQLPVAPQLLARRRQLVARRAAGDFFPTPIVAASVVTFRSQRRANVGARVLERQRFLPTPVGTSDVPRRITSTARRITGLRPRRGSFRQVPLNPQPISSNFFPFFG